MVTKYKKGYKPCGFEGCRKVVKEPKCYCHLHEGKAVNLIALEVKRLRSINQAPIVPYMRTIDEIENSEESNYEH